jgi:hypothetical protein
MSCRFTTKVKDGFEMLCSTVKHVVRRRRRPLVAPKEHVHNPMIADSAIYANVAYRVDALDPSVDVGVSPARTHLA